MKVLEVRSFRAPNKAPRFCSPFFHFVVRAKWLLFFLLLPSPGRLGQESGDLALLVRKEEVWGKMEVRTLRSPLPLVTSGFQRNQQCDYFLGGLSHVLSPLRAPRPWKRGQVPYGEHMGVEHAHPKNPHPCPVYPAAAAAAATMSPV